jgi:anti-sigma factor RsiW
MEHPSLPERPNTVSGLNAKRDELLAYRKALHAEVRKVTCDIDHLEAAIRLFEPGNTPAAFKRYVVRHRAKKGTVKRFILGMLREATAPITSAQITEAWLEARGLRTDDDTRIAIRKRIGAALTSLRTAGTAKQEGFIDGLKGWTRV